MNYRVFSVVCSLSVMVMCFAQSAHHASASDLTQAQKESLKSYFGFAPMEIYKLDENIKQLTSVDLNGDGLNDLIVINNHKSKIDVLIQRPKQPPASTREKLNVNDLDNPWRFERKPVPVRHRISSLSVIELSGDSYPDLVYFGEPKELVTMINQGDGTFSAPTIQRVRDGLLRKRSVATGDLNGDGRGDVALLGERDVLIFYQREGGGLERPVYSAHAASQPFTLDIVDVNGDDRDDLIMVPSGDVQVRLQTPSGRLGPQQPVELPAGLRTWEFEQCLGRRQADLFGVETVSGRFKRWQFEVTGQNLGKETWPVWYFPYPSSEENSNRPMGVGDIDGDGYADLVAADSKSAQMLLYQQSPKDGLRLRQKFGGQVNMRDLHVRDLDDDGHFEVIVCSADERAISVSGWDQGRLTFPRPLQSEGTPQSFDLASQGQQVHWLAYVYEKDRDYFLRVDRLNAAAGWQATEQENILPELKIEDYGTEPSAVRLLDVNQDGKLDVTVFAPYETLATFVQLEDQSFEQIRGGSAQVGLVKDATVQGFDFADVTGDGVPEVILAQRSFARALRVNSSGQWEVVDQFNAPTSSAEITGVAVLGGADGQRPNIALYDKRNRELHWLEPRSDNTYETTKSLPLASFELKNMFAAQLHGQGVDHLVLADSKKFAFILPHGKSLQVVEKAVFETEIKDGKLYRPAIGDLNNDGRSDIVVTEGTENYLEVITFGPEQELLPVTRFKVFATKRFSGDNDERVEPRDLLISDLNGDGHEDLAIIVHDRVIIYPSE